MNSVAPYDMSLTAVLQVTLLSGLSFLMVSTYISYKFLANFPGPFLARFTKLWYAKSIVQENAHKVFDDLIKKYGHFVRIAPDILVTDDADLFIKVNAVKSPYRRSPSYNAAAFDPRTHNTVSTLDEGVHATLRSKVGFAYSGKDIEGIEEIIDARVQDLISLIRTKYISTPTVYRPIDFAVKASFLTLDILTSVAFGAPFGYLSQDEDVYDYIAILNRYLPIVALCQVFPWLDRVLRSRVVRYVLGILNVERNSLAGVMRVAREVVATRYGPGAVDKKDMMGSFVRHGLTRLEAESESLLQLIAGSDTSATAIRMTWFHIISNPQTYQRLHTEIETGIANGTISTPYITNTEARSLPYLQACIKEGLRIHPPPNGIMPKVVPASGDTHKGVQLPGGTTIGFCHLAIHHSMETYGPDADVFRPERWLEAKGEKLKRMTTINDLVFASGRFRCLGYPLALMELNKIFVQLVRNFEFTVAQPDLPFESRAIQIFIQKGMWMRVCERSMDVHVHGEA